MTGIKSRICLIGCASAMLVIFVACSGITSDGSRAVFAGEGAKTDMLNDKVKLFSRARFWRDNAAMLAMMEAPLRKAKAGGLSSEEKKERLVDVSPSNVILGDDGDTAKVKLTVKYFQVPVYQVEEREEELHWVFRRLDGGWYIDSWEKGEVVNNES